MRGNEGKENGGEKKSRAGQRGKKISRTNEERGDGGHECEWNVIKKRRERRRKI